MEKPAYEKCYYLSIGQCPNQSFMEKVLLIPQLLEPSEVEDAIEDCKSCGGYLQEQRKYFRIKRPFRCDISKNNGTTIEGHIINISENGALIKLKRWVDFNSDEKVGLIIYSADEPIINESRTIEILSQIKRLTTDKKQLGIHFLSEINP